MYFDGITTEAHSPFLRDIVAATKLVESMADLVLGSLVVVSSCCTDYH